MQWTQIPTARSAAQSLVQPGLEHLQMDSTSACSTPGEVSPTQSRGAGLPPWPDGHTSFDAAQVQLAFQPWGHIAGSCPNCHPPAPSRLFLQGCALSSSLLLGKREGKDLVTHHCPGQPALVDLPPTGGLPLILKTPLNLYVSRWRKHKGESAKALPGLPKTWISISSLQSLKRAFLSINLIKEYS